VTPGLRFNLDVPYMLADLCALANSLDRVDVEGRVCHHLVSVLGALCATFGIKNYVEIGTHNGASMSYVLRDPTPKVCTGIDPFEKVDRGTHYWQKDHINKERTARSLRKNNPHGHKINLIQGLSQSVLNPPPRFSIDLFFIDGDHELASVLRDFGKFSDCVKKGGFVVFDDLHQEGPGGAFAKIAAERTEYEVLGVVCDNGRDPDIATTAGRRRIGILRKKPM
jgi:predicted O-methyltransferase YrrM